MAQYRFKESYDAPQNYSGAAGMQTMSAYPGQSEEPVQSAPMEELPTRCCTPTRYYSCCCLFVVAVIVYVIVYFNSFDGSYRLTEPTFGLEIEYHPSSSRYFVLIGSLTNVTIKNEVSVIWEELSEQHVDVLFPNVE